MPAASGCIRLRPERLERDTHDSCPIGVRDEALGPWSARQDDDPRAVAERRCEGGEEIPRRLVHPVRVLDDDYRRRLRGLCHERCSRILESRTPRLLVERLHLGGDRHG